MRDIRCGTCRHYEPVRNPDTGRIKPSEGGWCRWTHPASNDPVPYSMRNPWYGKVEQTLGRALKSVLRIRCEANTGRDCKCWEAKK